MSYQVLARKWRPRSFSEMVGQGHVLRALINALDNDRLHHAFLFTGTRGVGKTTVARILAKSLNCDQGVTSTPCGECESCRAIDEGRFVDLIEVDAASRTKVEDTRELLENVQYAPTRGRYKVYLIDEVHMLSTHSFNALLKTLEEPPPHVKFLLATTDPQRLPVTILSRCLQFNLKRLPVEAIRDHLVRLLQQESVDAEAPAVLEVARAADGSMRDALSLLDQAIAFGNGRLALAEVREMLGSVDRDRVFALLDALAAADGAAMLGHTRELAEFAPDFAAVLAELATALHAIALLQAVPDALGEQEPDADRLADMAGRLAPEDVQLYYQIVVTGRRDLPLAPDPRTGFEMALLRMLAFRPAGGTESAPGPARNPPARSAPKSSPAAGAAVSAAPSASATPPSSARPRGPAAPVREETPQEPDPEPEPAPSEPEIPDNVPAAKAVVRPGGDWAATVEALQLTGVVRQIAVNSTPAKDDGARVELVADPACAGLLSDKRRQQIEEALGRARGTPVRLTIRIGGGEGETPAQQARRAADERMQAAEAAIAGDADLQNILERFEGSIEPGSIRPVD